MAATKEVQYHQVRGKDRTKLKNDLKKRYRKGASIRQLAEEEGKSYGFIHRLLQEASTQLRSRGGAHGRRAAKADG